MRKHWTTPCKPPCCGSQEYWFGKTCQEEESRLGRRPGYPNGETVENTASDIAVMVEDEIVSVEEISENTDVNTYLDGKQKITSEQVFCMWKECGKCFQQNED